MENVFNGLNNIFPEPSVIFLLTGLKTFEILPQKAGGQERKNDRRVKIIKRCGSCLIVFYLTHDGINIGLISLTYNTSFMKARLPLLFVAMILMTQVSIAQFRVGGKAGVNITKVKGEAFRDEFQYGYHLGGFAEIGVGDKWAIQPEVLFNQYQTRVDSSFKNIYSNALDFSNYQDVKLNYLSIPVLLNYKVGSLLTLQAGPQVGILVDQSKNLLQNGREAFSTGDFSMLGGAIINLGKLRLSGRYFVGLNNISEISDKEKWNNEGFQLSVGLAL